MSHHRYIVLSDIHANLSALQAVLDDIRAKYSPDGLMLLGDLIDYGMRSNEIIDKIEGLEYPVLVNLCGNHEKAILDMDLSHFSSDRGREMLMYTASRLSVKSKDYIRQNMTVEGYWDFYLNGLRILAVHGNIDDPLWGKLTIDSSNDTRYSQYDLVISGHIHRPFMFERYFKCDSKAFRNEKKTIFANPGSVGQPRNHNPKAQYLYMDLEAMTFAFQTVDYDIKTEQNLYPTEIDSFYKERLSIGI